MNEKAPEFLILSIFLVLLLNNLNPLLFVSSSLIARYILFNIFNKNPKF